MKRQEVNLTLSSCEMKVGKTNKLIHVDDLIKQLHSNKLNGHLYQDTILPGMNKPMHFQHSVCDASFVIYIIDGDHISTQYMSQITDSYNFKTKQNIDECIIPVFIDREHESTLMTRHPQLDFINVYEAAYVEKDDWIARIIHRMTTPSLGEIQVTISYIVYIVYYTQP